MDGGKMQGKSVTGRKAEQVLSGAGRIFLRDGFAGAAVDEIARTAGVSKATLYAYYPDKEQLFHAAMMTVMNTPRPQPLAEIGPDLPAEKAIPRIAAALTGWLSNEQETDLFRLAIGESHRFPEIARAYQKRIEDLLEKPLRERLHEFTVRKLLKIDDIAMASQQLLGLCGLIIYDRAISGAFPGPELSVRRTSETAASVFLRAYGMTEDRQPA